MGRARFKSMKSANTRSCKKCLQLSLPVDMMICFAKLVNPNYNIYKRTGLKEGMPISNQDAANIIVNDMVKGGYFIYFVEELIRINANGYMGRRYTLWGLNDAIAGLVDEGYSFDKTTGQFFENQNKRISANWGRLQEGDERKMAVLRMDIAGNSALVKNNPRPKIEKAYNDIRNIVSRSVTSRLGRLWSWEGDGALAAFLFGPTEKMAVYAGVEILNELFFYNRLHNPLDSPINLRLGVQVGLVRYSDNETERLKNETVKQAVFLESLTESNSLGVSCNIYITMDQISLSLFSPEKTKSRCKYRLYTARPEK